MMQRRNPFYRGQMDASIAASQEQTSSQYSGFRIRFFFGLLTFLIGLTGFLIVLAIAVNGS